MSNQLTHYGVKGMKWGVRRYQDKSGRLTSAGKKRYSKNGADKSSSETNSRKGTGKSAESFIKSKSKMPVDAKVAGAGEELVTYLVAYAAIYGIMYASARAQAKSFTKKKMDELESMKDNRTIKDLNSAPKLSKPIAASESMKVTNPDFPSEGTTQNCTFCTTAMVMREKGFNVRANKTPTPWPSKELFNKTFNSPTIRTNKCKTGKDLTDTLAQNGEGSYGNLGVNWKNGGGHSVFWKVENGKVRIYDGQSGEEYTSSPSMISKFHNAIVPQNSYYNRLDNCEPTEYALALVESDEK